MAKMCSFCSQQGRENLNIFAASGTLDNQSTKTKHWAQEDQTVRQIESLLGEERQERAAEIEPTEDVEDVYPVIKVLQPSATQNTPVYYEGIRLL